MNNQIYFKFYKPNKFDKIIFTKFLSKNLDITDKTMANKKIGFCYNTISNNKKVYNDLYYLKCKYLINFRIDILDLKNYDIKIYLRKNDKTRDKILNLYQDYLTKKDIKYYLNEFDYLRINYNDLIYTTGLTLENDKQGFTIYSFLDLDIKFYLELLNLIDIFNLELTYNDIKDLKIDRPQYFRHNKRIKYIDKNLLKIEA